MQQSSVLVAMVLVVASCQPEHPTQPPVVVEAGHSLSTSTAATLFGPHRFVRTGVEIGPESVTITGDFARIGGPFTLTLQNGADERTRAAWAIVLVDGVQVLSREETKQKLVAGPVQVSVGPGSILTVVVGGRRGTFVEVRIDGHRIPLPDLTVHQVGHQAPHALAEGRSQLGGTVCNVGSVAVPGDRNDEFPYWHWFALSTEASPDESHWVASTGWAPDFHPLQAGECAIEANSVQLPVELPPAKYFVVVVLDVLDKLLEENEDNNWAASEAQFIGRDFRADHLQVTPTSPGPTDKVAITTSILLEGAGIDTWPVWSGFKWRLSVDGIVVAEGVSQLGAPGHPQALSFTDLGPFAPGLHSVTFEVDVEDVVPETDEENNRVTGYFRVL